MICSLVFVERGWVLLDWSDSHTIGQSVNPFVRIMDADLLKMVEAEIYGKETYDFTLLEQWMVEIDLAIATARTNK